MDFAPYKVITFNPLCILFCISSLLLFDGSLLKAIAKDYRYTFKSVKERQLLLSQ